MLIQRNRTQYFFIKNTMFFKIETLSLEIVFATCNQALNTHTHTHTHTYIYLMALGLISHDTMVSLPYWHSSRWCRRWRRGGRCCRGTWLTGRQCLRRVVSRLGLYSHSWTPHGILGEWRGGGVWWLDEGGKKELLMGVVRQGVNMEGGVREGVEIRR